MTEMGVQRVSVQRSSVRLPGGVDVLGSVNYLTNGVITTAPKNNCDLLRGMSCYVRLRSL
jgi:hypothetical protein